MNSISEHDLERVKARLRGDAMRACANAHAVYSQFPVGAAVLCDDDDVYSGCNVENASYGLTICAERNALAQAVARGIKPGQTRALLIYTPGEVAHTPCGACRQVMQEFLPDDAVVVACCDSEHIRVWTIDQLIPDPFKFS